MATRSRSTRTTRTRAELDTELEEVKARTTSREVLDPKAQEAQRRADQEARQAAANITVQKAAQKVTSVGIELQGAVAKVGEQLMETTQELATIQHAVSLAREELEELHGKDVIASSIDSLLAQHAEQEKQLEQQVHERRTQWNEEQIAHQKEQKAYQENLTLVRQRDEDEHQYATQQRRRAEQDKWEESQRQLQKQSRERQELLEKGWTQREEQIKAREKDVADAIAKATQLTEENKKLEQSVSALGAQLRDFRHQTALDKAGFDQKLALEVQKNQALDSANKALAEQVVKLTQQLDAARTEVKDIASKAVEGASGRLALSEIRPSRRRRRNCKRE
jgi:colicin import membrane protein